LLFQSGLGIFIHESGLSIVYLKSSFKTTKVENQADYSLDSNKPFKERMLICADLIHDFIKSNNVESSDIFLGIPRESVILRDIEFPVAVKENLRSTLEYKIENYVPLKVENVYFDYQIIEEDKQHNRLKILLVVVQKDLLDTYFRFKDRFGIGLTGISIDSTAYVNFFTYHPSTSQEFNYVFVYETGRKNNQKLHLGVVLNKVLQYSRSVSVSLENDIDTILSKELRPVKEFFANYPDTVKLFYMSDSDDNIFFPHLEAREEFQIQIPDPAMAEIANPSMIPAMGLALEGVKKVPMQINLLPAILRKRPSRKVFYIMFALIGLFFISGLIWGGSKIMRQSIVLSQLNSETERLAAEIKNIDDIRDNIKNLETRIEYLDSLWRMRVPLVEVLKEVTERIPETAWLQDLNYDEKGVQIYGYADSASELISLLEASPLFSDVVFLATITRGQDGKERFRIGFKINS
jgi:Tfp pilus assembly protein PilN